MTGFSTRPALDLTRPNAARVYDYLLGGKTNFAADREQGDILLGICPLLAQRVRENRAFLGRVVTWLAAQGITQFVDVGCGLPATRNIHQIAQAANPLSRVAYVDNDRVVISHANALLTGAGVMVCEGDLTNPKSLLNDPGLQAAIDLDEPAAVILAMVLHFVDYDAACGIVTEFADALAPGSYLVVSVGSGDEETGAELIRSYSAQELHNHAPDQVLTFFAGLDLMPPGLCDAARWRPGPATPLPGNSGGHILACVGHKPH